MPALKPSSLQDLKFRANLLEVVGHVVSLKKAGARYKGLCPFHQEKTPSFHVDPDKGFYKCFGCGKAGDAITFVRETEQLNFTEAVETLARRFGVTLEYEEGAGPSREERSLRQELYDLHEQAADFYHQAFLAHTAGGDFIRAYWTEKRRFPAELAAEFKIGFAPPDDQALAALLLKKRYSEGALRQCGLFFVRDGALLTLGALRPRFRGRLAIPIRDHQGRVVAFTARQTELTPADDPAREAKYVNSPETPIFTKGHLLFNLDRARQHAAEGRPFVLVEGQLDALRCWHVGLKTAVAPQGTSITDSQLALLRRYLPQVECFLDGDAAGQKAAMRFLPMALRAGLEAKFIVLQKGDDPDSLFRDRGLPAYEELRGHALSAMAFACRSLLPDAAAAGPEQKARVTQGLHEIIAAAESAVARAGFLAEAAALWKLSPAALERDFRAHAARQAQAAARQPAPPPAPPPAADPAHTPEHDLLLLCLHYETLGKPLAGLVHHDWIDASHAPGRLLNRCLAEFEHDAWPGRDHLDTLLETPEEKSLAASLLFDAPAIDDPVKVANEGLRRLQHRALVAVLRQIELEIAAKATDIDADVLPLLKKQSDLQKQLRQPPALAAFV